MSDKIPIQRFQILFPVEINKITTTFQEWRWRKRGFCVFYDEFEKTAAEPKNKKSKNVVLYAYYEKFLRFQKMILYNVFSTAYKLFFTAGYLIRVFHIKRRLKKAYLICLLYNYCSTSCYIIFFRVLYF